jgi:PPOX class probable F420-dependent enzyme
MAIPLNDNVRKLIDAPNFAVVATLNDDGSPQTSVLWITRDGDDLLFCTVRGRRKERNLARDPRISVTVIDSSDGYSYAELRGTVTMTDDGGRN